MSLRDFAIVILIWVPVAVNAMGCPAPTLAHGYFQPDQKRYAERDVLFYGCDSDYKPEGDAWWAVSTCTGGTWRPLPKCIGKDLCNSPIIDKGEVQRPTKAVYEAGESIVISCLEGYHAGNAHPICSNGIWTPEPNCEVNRCGIITQITNGEAKLSGTTVRYTCKSGYILRGAATVRCLNNGQWSTIPVCEARDATVSGDTAHSPIRQESQIDQCGPIPEIAHAAHEAYAWSVLYKCQRGYKLETDVSRAFCYSDRSWSTPLPRCIDCSYYDWPCW